MSDNSPFKVKKEGYITWLIFDQPKKRNALGAPGSHSHLPGIGVPQNLQRPFLRLNWEM